MYSSPAVLAVAGEAQARDPERLRGLFWPHYAVLLLVTGLCDLFGFASLALGLWLLSSAGREAAPLKDSAAAASVLIGLGAVGMLAALAFMLEAFRSPLFGFRSNPAAYDVVKGRIASVRMVQDGRHWTIQAEARFDGPFGEGLALVRFPAALWRRFVADPKEIPPSLGDEWHGGPRPAHCLPVDAWILYRRDKPAQAAVVGLPKEIFAS